MGDNKSGFELRTELIGMAIGILDNKKHGLFANETLKPEGDRDPVKPYTTEEVLEVAEKLYNFIQKK